MAILDFYLANAVNVLREKLYVHIKVISCIWNYAKHKRKFFFFFFKYEKF